MEKIFLAVLLAGLALPLRAQTAAGAAGTASAQEDTAKASSDAKKAKKAAPAAAAKPAAAAAASAAKVPAAAQTPAAPAEKKQAAKQADQDEESMVMIDNTADAEAGRYRAQESEAEDAAAPGGLPTSYGQCKGVLNEGGRNLLVFESADDGTISFVQVVIGRGGISWKLVDRIPRSAE